MDLKDGLTGAFKLVLGNPIVILPAVVPIILRPFLQLIPSNPPAIFAGFDTWFLSFTMQVLVVDLANDAYDGKKPSLASSIDRFADRFVCFLLISMTSTLLAMTLLAAPVAIFLPVITVVDGTGPLQTLRISFRFIRANLRGMSLFVILIFLILFSSSLFPFGRELYIDIFSAILTITALIMYKSAPSKRRLQDR